MVSLGYKTSAEDIIVPGRSVPSKRATFSSIEAVFRALNDASVEFVVLRLITYLLLFFLLILKQLLNVAIIYFKHEVYSIYDSLLAPLVLRNWERDLEDFDAGGVDDVDLLVNDPSAARNALRAIPVLTLYEVVFLSISHSLTHPGTHSLH